MQPGEANARWPRLRRANSVSRCESQFPTATFALKMFLGLLLGSCASAAWTLHRAHLCQRAVRSCFEDMERGLHHGLLQSTSQRHPLGCYSVCMHFRFHGACGEVSPAKSISWSFQSVVSNSERTPRYQVISFSDVATCRTRTWYEELVHSSMRLRS